MIDISIYLLPLVLAASALMRLPENPILAPHRQILISIFWFSTVQDVDIFRYIYHLPPIARFMVPLISQLNLRDFHANSNI